MIDLSGLVFHAGAIASYDISSHMLTVTSNGITDTLTLINPDGTAFKSMSDGATGTEVVLVPAIKESLANDTGFSSTDKITSNPKLTGSGDPNAVVHFTLDGSPILDTATADTSGTWTFTPTGLTDGPHTIVASETDQVGNTGSASLTFTLDTTPPEVTITSDVLNNKGTFSLTGTAEINSAINIYDGATLLGSTTPGSDGKWNFTTAALSKTEVHSFTVPLRRMWLAMLEQVGLRSTAPVATTPSTALRPMISSLAGAELINSCSPVPASARIPSPISKPRVQITTSCNSITAFSSTRLMSSPMRIKSVRMSLSHMMPPIRSRWLEFI